MGVTIINSTLNLIFVDRLAAVEALSSMLNSLISFRTDNKTPDDLHFWKSTSTSSITLNNFLDFVIQPFVATLLISDDLRITKMEAEKTHVTSRKYGLKFNFETDDSQVDNITMKKGKFCFIR